MFTGGFLLGLFLTAGPSTAPLAMRLRETPLRMTILHIDNSSCLQSLKFQAIWNHSNALSSAHRILLCACKFFRGDGRRDIGFRSMAQGVMRNQLGSGHGARQVDFLEILMSFGVAKGEACLGSQGSILFGTYHKKTLPSSIHITDGERPLG